MSLDSGCSSSEADMEKASLVDGSPPSPIVVAKSAFTISSGSVSSSSEDTINKPRMPCKELSDVSCEKRNASIFRRAGSLKQRKAMVNDSPRSSPRKFAARTLGTMFSSRKISSPIACTGLDEMTVYRKRSEMARSRDASPCTQFNGELKAPTTAPVKKNSTSQLIKQKLAKLPPPLNLAKKKTSCPSFQQPYNNNILPITTPPPSNTPSNIYWIKNETGCKPADLDSSLPAHLSLHRGRGNSQLTQPHNRESTHSVGGSPPCTSKSRSCPSFLSAPRSSGARYKLIKEGQIQVCRLVHPRTVIGKLSSSKLLRRWETHTLFLAKECIRSATPCGFLEQSVHYSTIEDIHVMPHFDSTDKFCLRIYIPDGSLLLQTNHTYSRNQWLHSIHWRRDMLRFRRIIETTNRPEVLLTEIKRMVEQTTETPLQDDLIYLQPVQISCIVLKNIHEGRLCRTLTEPVITCIAALLETLPAVAEICPWFSRYCHDNPRSRIIDDVFVQIAHNTLKKNMDFGKFPMARTFVQNTLLALFAQNGGADKITNFVNRVHGPTSACPHPPVIKNLISGCLAAIHSIFEPMSAGYGSPLSVPLSGQMFDFSPSLIREIETYTGNDHLKLECFSTAFLAIACLEDWVGTLASMLQPLPFPESAFADEAFARCFKPIIAKIGTDSRCQIHSTVLGVREGKEGWFHLCCPGGPACIDDGELYAQLLKTLLHCCCKRKRFFNMLNSMIGPLQLLALRENETAMEAMCGMLEMEVVDGEDMKLQMITALQSTDLGKQYYAQLCDRQIALTELQSKGGPRKLSLPSKSTDGDLAVLLSSGSFGNLEWLSLAFTNVTSACADYLIKLPSLRYLNLWSTQFGDLGVQMISEHLHRLQVLNLCETPSTDKGLASLAGLKNLRKLNLCSTRLSPETFQAIKASLPALQEVDIRYTDAWCDDDVLTTP